MSFYGNLATTAKSLLTEYGQEMTITRVTETADPVTGEISSIVEESGTFQVVNPPASGGTVQAFDERIAGEAGLLYDNIRFVIIAAKDAAFRPKRADIATLQGVDYFILGITPVSPDGTDLVYKAGLRR